MAVPPIGARGGPWPPASTPANSADTRYVLQHILGICRVVRSLWDMRYDDWRNVGRRSYEGIKLPDTAATLLHSASDGSTTGQSAHDRFVSRYVPPPARLRSKSNT